MNRRYGRSFFCTLLLVFTLGSWGNSYGTPQSDETEALWQIAKDHYDQSKYLSAIDTFEKLLKNYPTHPRFLEGKSLLGLCYLKNKEPLKALKQFQDIVLLQPKTEFAYRNRIFLALAFLELDRFHEALLTAIEISRHAQEQITTPPELKLEAHLIRGWANIGLKKSHEARLSLDAFQQNESQATQHLKAQAAALALALQSLECSIIRADQAMLEDQAALVVERKSVCTLESLHLFKSALEIYNPYWSEQALHWQKVLFSDFSKTCLSPPPPRGKRTPEELKRYRAELASHLTKLCNETRNQALSTLNEIKKTLTALPPTTLIDLLAQHIRGLYL